MWPRPRSAAEAALQRDAAGGEGKTPPLPPRLSLWAPSRARHWPHRAAGQQGLGPPASGVRSAPGAALGEGVWGLAGPAPHMPREAGKGGVPGHVRRCGSLFRRGREQPGHGFPPGEAPLFQSRALVSLASLSGSQGSPLPEYSRGLARFYSQIGSLQPSGQIRGELTSFAQRRTGRKVMT